MRKTAVATLAAGVLLAGATAAHSTPAQAAKIRQLNAHIAKQNKAIANRNATIRRLQSLTKPTDQLDTVGIFQLVWVLKDRVPNAKPWAVTFSSFDVYTRRVEFEWSCFSFEGCNQAPPV